MTTTTDKLPVKANIELIFLCKRWKREMMPPYIQNFKYGNVWKQLVFFLTAIFLNTTGKHFKDSLCLIAHIIFFYESHVLVLQEYINLVIEILLRKIVVS